MNTLKKLSSCTVGAFSYERGISVGMLEGVPGQKVITAIASLEENDGRMQLYINHNYLNQKDIEIKII